MSKLGWFNSKLGDSLINLILLIILVINSINLLIFNHGLSLIWAVCGVLFASLYNYMPSVSLSGKPAIMGKYLTHILTSDEDIEVYEQGVLVKRHFFNQWHDISQCQIVNNELVIKAKKQTTVVKLTDLKLNVLILANFGV